MRASEKGIVFLSVAQVGNTGRAMGRPPLNMKPTPVRLSAETLNRIDAVAGNYGRAKFIREAVEAELKRREG